MALTTLFSLAVLPAHAWNPFAAPRGESVTVTAPYTELRTGPGRGYPIIRVVEKGKTMRVFKRRTDWYKVEIEKGIVGWVKNNDLTDSKFDDNSLADFSKTSKEQYDNRKFELGVAGGDFSGADGLTVYLGYHLTPNISTEIKYTQAFGEFSTLKLYSANIVHQVWPHWRVSPFFTLGTGIMQTSPNSGLVETIDREDNILTSGGGLFIYLSRNFLARIEYNNHTVLTTREVNEEVHEWKAGFSVFF